MHLHLKTDTCKAYRVKVKVPVSKACHTTTAVMFTVAQADVQSFLIYLTIF